MEMSGLDYFALVLAFIGSCTLMYYRNLSRQNFFFKRAPHLKISDIHVHDDVWVTGIIDPIKLVVPPFFFYETIQYSYSMFEKVVHYKKDANGNERRVETWELRHTENDASQFLLKDGSGELVVNPKNAIIKFPFNDFYQDQWFKHILSYLPASGLISAVGVVSDKKDQLIQKGEIPLMVTPMGRKQFNQSIKTQEVLSKFTGLFALWLSFSSCILSFNDHYSVFSGREDSSVLYIISGVLAFIPFSIIYYYFTFNSLVALRTKTINSWANIDIELKNRRDLIPNLVTTLGQFLQNEKSSFQSLSECREKLKTEKRLSERIKIENEIMRNLSKIKLSIENTPDLKTEPVLLLTQEITTLENKISHAKSHFNAVVEEYNNLVCSFPSKWVAQFNYLSEVPYYGLESGKKLDDFGKRGKPKVADKTKHPHLNPPALEQIDQNETSKKIA